MNAAIRRLTAPALVAAALALAGCGSTKTVSIPVAPVTVTALATPTVTVTATPAVTVTVSVTPTVNAQDEATQISADGVYVVGQDIPGGTWHTSGGSQCYEATLAGLDPDSDIISNDNFTGPDTVDLGGVTAFDISGGCTWQQEG